MPGERPPGEGGGGRAALVRRRLGAGAARAAATRDVHAVEADAPLTAGPAAGLGKARSEPLAAARRDAPRLLDAGVEQLPGAFALVAHDLAAHAMHPVATVKTGPAEARRRRPGAAEMLGESLRLLADEPDEATKLRKLRTCAEIDVAQRAGFRVRDPSRARCMRAPAESA